MATTFIATIAIILYLMVGARFALRISKGTTGSGAKTPWLGLGGLAAILHAVALYQMIFMDKGVDLGLSNAIAAITWLIAVLFLITALVEPLESLGIAVLPLAALGLLVGIAFPSHQVLTETAAIALEAHILISFLAYGLFAIAALQAVLLAIQERQLHGHRPGGFMHALPPLQTTETLLFRVIAVAFVLQTLSLLTGMLFLENMFAQHVVHKTVLSLIAWLIFAGLLWGRWRSGWRGRTAVRWTLSGFTALVLAYLGSKWVLEIVLHR